MPFTILAGATPLATVLVNQQLNPVGVYGRAERLGSDTGTFAITGNTLVVQLSNVADGRLNADAIRIQPRGRCIVSSELPAPGPDGNDRRFRPASSARIEHALIPKVPEMARAGVPGGAEAT